MNEEQLNRIEEKLDFLIYMHTKTIPQPPALAGGRPRITMLPGELLFQHWKDAKEKAKKAAETEQKPLPDENFENPMKQG